MSRPTLDDAISFLVARDRGADVTIDKRIQRDGTVTWAIRHLGWCLNTSGQWEHEPIPSSRDEAFMTRCRWATLQGAWDAAVSALRRDGVL